ncbi:hypothetical protein [Spirosoma oryzicola]|uniref:hypothetical protein n=1 Tax=Spirosoma oryzicola TaxID=2898794 RepID=UPI001E39DFA5|nr:hypothetical protein [Spirosoma oryzicola]UHG93265.1 hypothetical protein LQ777_10270 [Spirosoma oryzicola]
MNTTDQSNNETPQTASPQIKVNSRLTLTQSDAHLIDLMNDLSFMSGLRDEVRDWFLAYASSTEFGNASNSCGNFETLDGFFSAVILKAAKHQLAQKGGQTNE